MPGLAVGYIPARLASTRLPRKLLLAETGWPLIRHTWEGARRATALRDLVVATDSLEIASACAAFGARCEMTSEHASGTDRIAEAVRRGGTDAPIIVNIQGDEPEIDPAQINLLVELLERHPGAQMSTLATPITSAEVRDSPSCVKVVADAAGRALYFSRAPVPYCRDGAPSPWHAGNSPWRLHLGVYAYRREFLLAISQMPQSPLERLERLEQLRALEAGAVIQVGVVGEAAVGIDTAEEYARFVARARAGRVA
jgi:3-deoxy-manno-octulosonate cytidylyltransferase (CMP-KDO synthetase)